MIGKPITEDEAENIISMNDKQVKGYISIDEFNEMLKLPWQSASTASSYA